MNIGIDARLYGPFVGGGGLGRYTQNLVDNLSAIDQENRFIVFLKKENYDLYHPSNPNFEKRLADTHWYTLKEQILMPNIIDTAGLDLIHFPHWNIPVLAKTPFIVTIHDLILLDEPRSAKITTKGKLMHSIKFAGFKITLNHAIKKSRHIIAVSEWTKQSILKHFNVPQDKITVIHEGVSEFVHNEIDESDSKIKDIKSLGKYILYVGSAYPHKNLKALLRAFLILRIKMPDARLVLVGKEDVFYKQLKKYAQDLGLNDENVKFYGYASDEELAALYKFALLYVFPSKHEGFGLPPLEAMARGTAVAAARASSLPEILGDACAYFDPNNENDIANAISLLANNENLRAKYIEKGYQQAGRYSWTKMAQKTDTIYKTYG